LPVRNLQEIRSVGTNSSENKASAFHLLFIGHSGTRSATLPDTSSCQERVRYCSPSQKDGQVISTAFRKTGTCSCRSATAIQHAFPINHWSAWYL